MRQNRASFLDSIFSERSLKDQLTFGFESTSTLVARRAFRRVLGRDGFAQLERAHHIFALLQTADAHLREPTVSRARLVRDRFRATH